ncbi:hypothetical protein THOM_1488 [Trachipleistophora hominis]|uniref:RNA polymerase III subunit C3 n=1 Tax=Trachipleistophora hominis TaxID=72359 RepID=L7JW55_TRAHO|nr:hypothetical protein THOM_1488 [Trachipleistophora hominis]
MLSTRHFSSRGQNIFYRKLRLSSVTNHPLVMYKIYKFLLNERGTLLEPVVDFMLNLKTVTYKQLICNIPLDSVTLTKILKYLIQTRVVEYNIYQNITYYTINTRYILNRLFLPLYMGILSEKEQKVLLELFMKGVTVRKNDDVDAMLFVKSVSLNEVKSLLRLNFSESCVKEEKIKNVGITKRKKTKKYLIINFDYLEKKLLNRIVNDYMLERYIELGNKNILKYVENDRITQCKHDHSEKSVICTINNKNLIINTMVLKQWIVNRYLDLDSRKLYNFIAEKLFVPDDQIIKQVLIERQKIKPILFGLMQNGLIAIHKNGWVNRMSFGGVACALATSMELYLARAAKTSKESPDNISLISNIINISEDLFVLKCFK